MNLFIFFRKLKWFLIYYQNISFSQKLVSKKDICVENHFLGPITYSTDSLVTSNNCDFIKEPRFVTAYEAAAATNPWKNFTLQWRVYNVCWFANHVKDLEGDFVECGVNTGAYARAIIEYVDFAATEKCFYLFDTFSGLVPGQITKEESEAGIEKYLNNYKDVYEQVIETFNGFNTRIIKGKVPDTLNQFDGKKICYLSIDMNVTEPEIAAANFFWDKIVKGGVVMLDDYGFPPHINQKKSFDKFAKEKKIEILTMPTGQGLIIKPY